MLLNNKKASRDLVSLWKSRLARFESFCASFLGLQHFTPTFRRPAPPSGEEAVGKSEVVVGACAISHLILLGSNLEAGYSTKSISADERDLI